MKEFADDTLARSLATLEPRVDPDALTRRVLAGVHQRARTTRRRLLLGAAVAPLVMIGSATLASYYAPAFAQALADAPVAGAITGPMLRNVGLAAAPHRVTSIDDSVSSSGYRVDLVGGYADPGRTILFLRTEPAARVVFGGLEELTLRDQFGQSYQVSGSVANLDTGENTLIFEPFRGPALGVGARMQLQFNTLSVGVASPSEVTGRWSLGGTLAPHEGTELAVPSDGAIGEMSIAFSRLRSTPVALLLEMRIETGGLDMKRIIPDGAKGRMAFTVRLLDPQGRERVLLQADYGGTGTGGATAVAGSWLWLIEEPGVHEIRISYEGVGELRRMVNVH